MTANGRLLRRRPAALALLALLAVAMPAAAVEAADPLALAPVEGEQPRDRAVARALAWLRTHQRADGAVGDDARLALTALAVMAHLAAGHPPDDLQHGAWLRRSLGHVLAQQDADGYFGRADNSRMYGHGIATLLLAEVLGMSRDEETDERVRVALERAVAVTVNAAGVAKKPGHEGGWRYQPHEDVSDLSLSGWQVMSLHAARQAGMTVPDAVLAGAVAYALRLTGEDGRVGYDQRGEDRPALRGTALLCFAIGDRLDTPEPARVAERIRSDPIAWQGPWFFYRAYYDAVGLGRAAPRLWSAYAPTLERVLLEHQAADGSWPTPPGDNEGQHGGVYRTAMAVLALTVNRNLLPAYQR